MSASTPVHVKQPAPAVLGSGNSARPESKESPQPRSDSIECASCSCLPTWLQDCFTSIGNFFAACYNWIAGLFSSAQPAPEIIVVDPLKHLQPQIAFWKSIDGPMKVITQEFRKATVNPESDQFRLALVMTVLENGEQQLHASFGLNSKLPDYLQEFSTARDLFPRVHSNFVKECEAFFKHVESLCRPGKELDPEKVQIYLLGAMSHPRPGKHPLFSVNCVNVNEFSACVTNFPLLSQADLEKYLAVRNDDSRNIPFQAVKRYLFS